MRIPRGHAAVRCCLLRRPFVPGVSLGGIFSGMSVAYHYRRYSWSPLLVVRFRVSRRWFLSAVSGPASRCSFLCFVVGFRVFRCWYSTPCPNHSPEVSLPSSPKPLGCGISPETVQTKAARKNRLLAGSCLRVSRCSSHPPGSRLRRGRSSPRPRNYPIPWDSFLEQSPSPGLVPRTISFPGTRS